ncbi:MAG: CBS domain-containing protein [Ruminiclostridium sp.]|nr:CBS domain-containing protein [Ruminiclostridium sp.]
MNLIFLLRPKDDIVYITSDATVRQGLEKLKVHGYTAIPVISSSGEYVGTVSEGDFLWALCDGESVKALEKRNVSEIIRSKRDRAVRVSADMNELLLMIMEQNFVPVTDDRGKFIGIVTRRDIIKYFYDKEQEKENSQHE